MPYEATCNNITCLWDIGIGPFRVEMETTMEDSMLQRILRTNRNIVFAAIFAVLGALATASCATGAKLTDDMALDGSEGYISVYSRKLGIKITPVVDGVLGETLKNSDWWSTKEDFRIACPPGTHEFIVNHKDYEERFLIPVEAGRITFLSFRQQNQSVESSTSGFYGSYGGVTTTTTYTYFIRASVSTVTLSADPERLDASSLGVALEDPDWGIRHYAVKVLTGGKFEIDGDTAALIGRMSVEDPFASVRISAGKLLERKNLPRPAPPLFFESFEWNVSSRWKVGKDPETEEQFELSPAGYQVFAPKGRAGWSLRDIAKDLDDRDSCLMALECSWIGGSDTHAFGLMFGESEENFLIFCISRNGGVFVGRYWEDKWQEAAVPWEQTAAAEIAARTVHRIEVERAGDSYSFQVDGIPIADFTTDGLNFPDEVGVYVSGPQTVVFHKLMVY